MLPSAHGQAPEVFARVGDQVITVQDYAMALRKEGRKRFYHGQPPEAELAGFYRDTANRLVDRRLALDEARRRGLRAERARVDSELEQARQRTAGHARSAPPDETFWVRLRQRIEEEQLIAALRQQIEAAVRPGEPAVRAYYRLLRLRLAMTSRRFFRQQ